MSKDVSQDKEKEKRELSGKEKSSLKNLFYVLLDGRRITRRGKLPHFEVKIANEKWLSFEEAEKAVSVLVHQFYIEKQKMNHEKEQLRLKKAAEEEQNRGELEKKFRSLVVFNNDVYESILHRKKPCFLRWNGEEFTVVSSFIDEVDGITYYPLISREMYPYRPFVVEDLGIMNDMKPNLLHLLKKIYPCFDTFLDLEKEYRLLEAEQVTETYVQNKLRTLSYLLHIGDWDSGKTRACELHNFLCYRPMFGTDISKANIYRYIGYEQEGHVTIIEDEIQDLSVYKHATKMKIYRVGYRRNAKVPIILEDKLRTQRYYNTFCSKIFAGRYPPRDSAFLERCIIVPMIHGEPKKDEITNEDLRKFDEIRIELLNFRMRYFFEPLPKIELCMKGRIKELWKCKIQILRLQDEKVLEKAMLNMANKNWEDKKEARKASLEAFLTRSVAYNNKAFKGKEIPFFAIWNTLCKLVNADPSKNKTASDIIPYDITKTKIGLILKSVFGAEPHLRGKIGRTWFFRKDRIDRLVKKFGLSHEDINCLNGLNGLKGGMEEDEPHFE